MRSSTLYSKVVLPESRETLANPNSSQSDAIFQITLRRNGIKDIHGQFSSLELADKEA
jgi:hypothetical protein